MPGRSTDSSASCGNEFMKCSPLTLGWKPAPGRTPDGDRRVDRGTQGRQGRAARRRSGRRRGRAGPGPARAASWPSADVGSTSASGAPPPAEPATTLWARYVALADPRQHEQHPVDVGQARQVRGVGRRERAGGGVDRRHDVDAQRDDRPDHELGLDQAGPATIVLDQGRERPVGRAGPGLGARVPGHAARRDPRRGDGGAQRQAEGGQHVGRERAERARAPDVDAAEVQRSTYAPTTTTVQASPWTSEEE